MAGFDFFLVKTLPVCWMLRCKHRMYIILLKIMHLMVEMRMLGAKCTVKSWFWLCIGHIKSSLNKILMPRLIWSHGPFIFWKMHHVLSCGQLGLSLWLPNRGFWLPRASGPSAFPRATLKKNIVSGPAAGCVYYCRMGTFFFHFAPKIFFWSKFHHFLTNKKKGEKKEDFAAARLATISATRWTGFFKGGLSVQN